MIDLSDIGLAPVTSAATVSDAPVVANAPAHKGLVPGSALARALHAVWSGEPVVLIDSPPGSGKTTLLIDLIDQLLRRSDLQIKVATPTRAGALDVATRLVEVLKTTCTDMDRPPAVHLRVRNMAIPDYLPPDSDRSVDVATVAYWGQNQPECDVMFFDEAYQSTYASVSNAADRAAQVAMIGDPGQIGPVVTINTTPWDADRRSPAHRAPDVFALRDDVTVLRLGASYRLGQATVNAIAPLYGFSFESRRPDRWIESGDGSRMPELRGDVCAEPEEGHADLRPMIAVSDEAAALVGSTYHDTVDGELVERKLTQEDVCVVAAHNVQVKGVAAILAERGYPEIVVGTADSLQGGQWPAVVALDPTVGHDTLSDHQLSEGRLCVMASRHMAHLTWVHDGTWRRKMSAYAESEPSARNGIAVRRGILGD